MEKFNLDIPKMGYFIVYRRKEGFHPLNSLITNEQISEGFNEEDAQYTHVEVSLGGDKSVNAVFPFVKVHKISKKQKGRYVKIVAYDDHNYYAFLRYKAAVHAASKNNLPYGLWSLLWFKVNHLFKKNDNIFASRNAPFCSSLSAEALRVACPDSFENASIVMPAHFLGDRFTVIWEGVIE